MRRGLFVLILTVVFLVGCDAPGDGRDAPSLPTVPVSAEGNDRDPVGAASVTDVAASVDARDSEDATAGPVPGEADQLDSGDQTSRPGDPVALMCERWNQDRSLSQEGNWTGSALSCDPGVFTAPGPENTLRAVNLYRWLADLPPVPIDAQWSAMAQACAVLMHANGDIEHDVPPSWACRTPDGVESAQLSNLATTPAVQAVDLYVVDEGVTNLGHRRWVLSNSLDRIGVGSTDEYSCLQVIGGEAELERAWTAWPPPGPFPFEAVSPYEWESLDRAGWSIQSDSLDLEGASVTIRDDSGSELPIEVTTLGSWYGSRYAIRMQALGWTIRADTTYQVQVSGTVEPFSYEVNVVRCAGRF